jgi:hypothetical protein
VPTAKTSSSPAQNAEPHPRIHVNFGTMGPLQRQVRQLLGCGASAEEPEAALAFSHAGLPRPGRDLNCRHFVLQCDAPMLVLAASHHDACFYLLVNMGDKPSRDAFSRVYHHGKCEVVLADRVSASACSFMLEDDERSQLRAELNAHEGFMRDDHLWMLQLGELISRLPTEFANRAPGSAACVQHHVLVLQGNRDAHFSAVRAALNTVFSSGGTSTL